MTTTAEVNEFTGRLAELVKRVQSGNEVLLTQGHKPVAKIVSASENEIAAGTSFQIHSLKGHRVLTPVVSQSELADEMFERS
jgi:prevent-host-death family protein